SAARAAVLRPVPGDDEIGVVGPEQVGGTHHREVRGMVGREEHVRDALSREVRGTFQRVSQ
ncbi:MAG: hypothetical protein ACRDS9_20120, partial [Pseudonocardiaceae bacterium]